MVSIFYACTCLSFFFSVPFFIATVKFWSLQLVKRKNAVTHVPEAQQGNYMLLLVLYSRWFDSPKFYLYTFENSPGVEHTTKKKGKHSTSSSGASARYFCCPCIFLVNAFISSQLKFSTFENSQSVEPRTTKKGKRSTSSSARSTR